MGTLRMDRSMRFSSLKLREIIVLSKQRNEEKRLLCKHHQFYVSCLHRLNFPALNVTISKRALTKSKWVMIERDSKALRSRFRNEIHALAFFVVRFFSPFSAHQKKMDP